MIGIQWDPKPLCLMKPGGNLFCHLKTSCLKHPTLVLQRTDGKNLLLFHGKTSFFCWMVTKLAYTLQNTLNQRKYKFNCHKDISWSLLAHEHCPLEAVRTYLEIFSWSTMADPSTVNSTNLIPLQRCWLEI
jgi:hypothetical protein